MEVIVDNADTYAHYLCTLVKQIELSLIMCRDTLWQAHPRQ